MSKQEQLRNRVYQFYEKNHELGKRFIVDHFMREGHAQSTLYRIIKRCDQGKKAAREKGSGLKPVFNTSANRQKLKRKMNNKKGVSLSKSASAIGCSKTTVHRILKSLPKPIKCYKRLKKPKRTALQLVLARPKCTRIYKKYAQHDFILDDEAFFTFANTTLSGNDTFYSDDPKNAPDNVQHYHKSKFEQKLMCWIAISRKGVSQLYIVPSGQAVNQTVYLEECLKKRLKPFIDKYHRDTQYVFWPDLASSHYAASVIAWLEAEGISYMPKLMNPANLTEVRPIEDFWAMLKRIVYRDGWEAKNIDQLRNRIQASYRKIDLKVVQKLAQSTIKRIDAIRRNGLAC